MLPYDGDPTNICQETAKSKQRCRGCLPLQHGEDKESMSDATSKPENKVDLSSATYPGILPIKNRLFARQTRSKMAWPIKMTPDRRYPCYYKTPAQEKERLAQEP